MKLLTVFLCGCRNSVYAATSPPLYPCEIRSSRLEWDGKLGLVRIVSMVYLWMRNGDYYAGKNIYGHFGFS